MEPDKRLEILVSSIIVVAVGITFFDIPAWVLDVVVDLGTSFVVSGVFYVLLMEVGLQFLEDIRIGFVSGMTMAVFLIKNLLI